MTPVAAIDLLADPEWLLQLDVMISTDSQ